MTELLPFSVLLFIQFFYFSLSQQRILVTLKLCYLLAERENFGQWTTSWFPLKTLVSAVFFHFRPRATSEIPLHLSVALLLLLCFCCYDSRCHTVHVARVPAKAFLTLSMSLISRIKRCILTLEERKS